MSPEYEKILRDLAIKIGAYLGLKTKVDFSDQGEDDITTVNLTVPDASLLIGDGGGTLIAWQHLLRILFRKRTGAAGNFVLDINNYRRERQEYLSALALDTAQKVVAENRLVILKPMNSYERRVIHLALAPDTRVATESLGELAERRVIIKPTK